MIWNIWDEDKNGDFLAEIRAQIGEAELQGFFDSKEYADYLARSQVDFG